MFKLWCERGIRHKQRFYLNTISMLNNLHKMPNNTRSIAKMSLRFAKNESNIWNILSVSEEPSFGREVGPIDFASSK